MDERLILEQLDKWIEQADNTVDVFINQGMKDLAMYSRGMSQAYWNVKAIIEVNKDTHEKN